MLSPRGQLRFDRWREFGEPESPFTECLRADIPVAHWGNFRIPDLLTAAIKRIDRRFEIIYDPCTLTPGDPNPAFFLYSVKINRNGPSDALRLELPLQWDLHCVWPEGQPRVPGLWFIDEYRAHDNARIAGSSGYVSRLRMKQKYDRAVKAQAARDEPLIQFERAINEELDPYLNKGRLSDALCADGTQVPNAKKRKVWGLPTGKVRSANVANEPLIVVP